MGDGDSSKVRKVEKNTRQQNLGCLWCLETRTRLQNDVKAGIKLLTIQTDHVVLNPLISLAERGTTPI